MLINKCKKSLAITFSIIMLVSLFTGCNNSQMKVATKTVQQEEETSKNDKSPVQTKIIKNGLVSGTTGAQAIEGGVQILKEGGNAADAAIATSLGQIALAGGSWVSYTGIFNMVYYEASTGKVYDINGGYNTVKNETDPMTIEPQDLTGLATGNIETSVGKAHGRAVLVPGYMATVDEINKTFGKLPFEKLFQPAIAIAENGFEWSEGLARQFAYRKETLSRLPETKAIFTKSDGSFYKIGDIFKQPILAETLKKVAKEGSSYMYTGPWAEKFVKLVQEDGGKLTMEDLASYKPIITEPNLWESKNGEYKLYVHGAPAYGGDMLYNAMSLIDIANVPTTQHYTESPEALYDLLKIMNYTSNYTDKLLTNEEANDVWKQISNEKSTSSDNKDSSPKHSDAVVVIDKYGNIATVTHSINTVSWGETGIFVDGISINDSASIQQVLVQAAGPGNRLPDPTVPGIVIKDGKPFLGFAPIGAGLFQQTVTSLLNTMYFDMTPQEAVDQPFIGFNNYINNNANTVQEDKFNPEIINKVREMGIDIEENNNMPGYWVGITKDASTGELKGCTIPTLNHGGRSVGY